MKKRTFLKTSSVLIAGGLLSPMVSCKRQREFPKNWAGNRTYGTDDLYQPSSLDDVRQQIKKSKKIRILGSRHSFNGIADSTVSQMSLQHFDQIVALDTNANTVTVEPGVSYGKLAPYLHEKGYALHNLASLPHISVAGACSTATHGSGIKNENLSTGVAAVEFITAEGDTVSLSRANDEKKFKGAVVALGALGAITRITLDIQPSFDVRQDVYLNLPMQQLKDHFTEIMSAGYSVSLFTDWKSESVNQVWIKRKIEKGTAFEAAPEFFGAVLATRNVHPIIELSAENCTEQMGVPGPWYERLPHFKMNFTPSSGAELQAEYFVASYHAVEAILAVAHIHERVSPLLMISEIRMVHEDDLWMSPCYGQSCVAIHFTLKQDWPNVEKLLSLIERQLAIFKPRPHWAKLFTIFPGRLQTVYHKLPAFRDLLNEYDPQGKFRNEFIDQMIF